MRRCPLVVFALLSLWMVGDHPVSAQNAADNCPPRYRRDPAATARARDAKKAQMRQRGFPERFLSLLDREECVACVETASDGFHIMVVYNDDENAPKSANGRRWTSHSFGWDPQSERQVRDQLAAGKIKAFYIMNTATRCQCCPDLSDDSKTNASYADWNAELEVHMSHVITFDEPSDLGPLPPDLENPPGGWINDVPDIEQFTKPPHRQVHVVCPACEDLETKVNSAYDTLDSLWNQKINMLEGISITENAIGNRENQISRLDYQQLFSTRNDARQKQIDELTEVNRQQRDGLETTGRKLAELDRQIAETTADLARLMKLLLDCENRCKTTTASEPPSVAANQEPPATPQAPGAPALCRDCQAAAAEVARLTGAIQERAAALNQLAETMRANDANLNNLVALRADAAGRPDAATRVAEFEARIAELQAANRTIRAQQFSVQEEIRALNEALEKSLRDLEACNRRCAAATDLPATPGLGVTGGNAKRTVAVPPITPIAACKECASLADQLRAAHAELERLAQRANDRQIEADFADFEAQRAKVADLEAALAACNRKCATTTANNTGTLDTTGTAPTTTGTTPTTAGTTPTTVGTTPTGGLAVPPPALCPDCQAAAAEVARLDGAIRERSDALNRLGDRLQANDANLKNLMALRADAVQRSNAAARVAELEARISELQAANREIRAQQFSLQEEIRSLNETREKMLRDLDACNRRCATAVDGPVTGTGVIGGRATRTVAVNPIAPIAACKECEALADQLRTAHAALQDLAQRANDLQRESDFAAFETQRAKVADLEKELAACNRKCVTATTASATPTSTVGAVGANPPLGIPANAIGSDSCNGGDCFEIDTCSGGSCGVDPPLIPEPPGGFDSRYQIMGGEMEPLRINASGSLAFLQPPPQMASRRLNPLGFLARSFGEFLEWWSPMVHAAEEPLTLEQASRVPGGLQFLVTSLGGSTGKVLSMQVLNFTGKAINLQGMLALEPLKTGAQQRVTQAFSRLAGKTLPARVDLRGYCFEFLKLPPIAGQLMTVAAPSAQNRFARFKQVMSAANRLKRAGQLQPDSAPDSYSDSIKQWAVWAVEQKFNQARFIDAFAAHTKKNVEAAGQQWTRQADEVIRKVSPNRWQDIVKVLAGAGMQVPQ